MLTSAEYEAAARQVFRLAGSRLRQLVADRQPGTWAVAVDADETVISNTEYDKELIQRGEASSEELWDQWVARRAAPPLPGAIEFLELVHELGGRVAVVTNRQQQHCPDTEANFRAYDIPFDVVLCRGDDRDKEPRWARVERGTAAGGLPPLEIVMWLGDNIHDFPGMNQAARSAGAAAFDGFGDRYFILPNPLYGSWTDNPEH